jgi:hypothetical protein
MYVCTYVGTYVGYVYVYFRTHVCGVHVCMHVCVYACMYMCKKVSVLVWCAVTPVTPNTWQWCHLSCNFSAQRSFLFHSGVLYRFITPKGRVHYLESPHGIFFDKSGIGTDLSASTLAFQGQLFHPWSIFICHPVVGQLVHWMLQFISQIKQEQEPVVFVIFSVSGGVNMKLLHSQKDRWCLMSDFWLKRF